MKRLSLVFIVLLTMAISMTAFAADGKVIYSGDSGVLIFAPGSEESDTDLFLNFKDVMPGDSISQKITVQNDASNKVKVKIYMRSFGAHKDGVSEEFLSYMGLKVALSEDNTMGYMFDAQANETAQLTDWVCLGTLYSGGEVNLDVTLDVSVEMDISQMGKTGYIDWEFMVEEFAAEPSDPKPPVTGDDANAFAWLWVALGAAIVWVPMYLKHKKTR